MKILRGDDKNFGTLLGDDKNFGTETITVSEQPSSAADLESEGHVAIAFDAIFHE